MESNPLEERILLLAPSPKDAEVAQRIFARTELVSVACRSLVELCAEWERGAGVLLMTQEALLADKTECLRQALEKQPVWSDVPLIVLTVAGTESRQQIQALEAIGHMTLMKRPVQISELISTLKVALRDRRRQYAVRDFLAEREGQNAALRESEERLREAKNKAEEANRAKSEFLANMSHEIRTPMNAIVGLANILATPDIAPQKKKEFLRTLQVSAESLMGLITDLLDIAKIENERVELERIPFNLASVLETATEIVRVRAREKDLEVRLDLDPGANGVFLGDPLRFKQILLNLAGNAVKFTEKGSVRIRARLRDKTASDRNRLRVCVEVSDTGIGIPSNKIGALFRKFSQADNSITRRYGGTGLGLAITKKLVGLMEGKIEVESVYGEGSTFRVEIPLAPAAGAENVVAQSAEATADVVPRGRDAPHILLVEDYEANILVARTLLENLGYRCSVARNGREALDMLERDNFDLVLMDVQMPYLDGYSTTRQIRRTETEVGRPAVPIIGITAHALAGDREKCLAAGMDDYISKPFNPAELQQKIAAGLVPRLSLLAS